ncbi:MAG: sugar transferase [Chloroflexi bacterium]|nr:sugar transferase [Chloroflexota bacterium]
MAVDRNLQTGKLRIRGKERQFILFLGDLLATGFSVLAALFFWAQKDWLTLSRDFLDQRAPFWFYLLPLAWCLLLIEIYDVHKASKHSDVLKGVGSAAGFSLLIYLVIFFISDPNSLPRRGIAVFLLFAVLLTIIWRFVYIAIFTAPVFNRRVLMIGAGIAGTTLVEMVNKIKPPPFSIIGFIDDDLEKKGTEIAGYPVLGNGPNLPDCIKQEGITDLIFAISGELNPDLFRAVLEAEESGIEVSSLPTVYEEIFGRVPIFLLQSDWILRSFIDQARTSEVYESLKRLIDLLGGLIGFFILILITPLISLFIFLDDRGPILYQQMRVGKNGIPYNIYKFRTMRKDSESDGVARMTTSGDERITRFGKVLRRSHLDELPQVINILNGENSIVGPRAEQIELVNQFQQQLPFYRARLFVRPGLTGWAQINQRYASTVEDTAVKLEFDLYYIKHRNLLLDMNIILRTVGSVLGFRGL